MLNNDVINYVNELLSKLGLTIYWCYSIWKLRR